MLARCALLLTLPVVLTLILVAPAAHGQALECFVDDTGQLSCRVDASTLFDQEIRDLLDSGFTNDILYRVAVHHVEQDEPVGVALIAFAEVFRLYTEVYYISREGVEGYVARNDWESAVTEMSQFTLQFVTAESLEAGTYVASVLLEINPLNAEEIAEARRWIARTRGGYRLFGEGNRSFRTFVSLFVNTDQSTAEAVRQLRSAPFELINEP